MLAGGERHKITLMGPSAAGKTSIMHRYSSGSFSEDQVPTIGAAFTSSDIDTSKGKVTLNIWDTAGQERFKSLVPKYARGSSAVIVVFDSTSVNSLKEAQTIVEQESTIYDSKMIWFFVANKSDQEPSVNITAIQEWATERKLRFFRTSAKTGDNITELFNAVAEEVAGTLDESEISEAVPVEEPKPNTGGSCC